MPLSFAETADAVKGELWVSMDEFENRMVEMSSLYSRSMYKSVFQIKRKIPTSNFDKGNCIYSDVFKVVVGKTSTFMVNAYSYIRSDLNMNLFVKSADDETNC